MTSPKWFLAITPIETLYSEEAASTLILIHPKGGGAQVVELDGGKAGGETDSLYRMDRFGTIHPGILVTDVIP